MGLPGFSALCSLYRTRNYYQATIAGEMVIASNRTDGPTVGSNFDLEPARTDERQSLWRRPMVAAVEYDFTGAFTNNWRIGTAVTRAFTRPNPSQGPPAQTLACDQIKFDCLTSAEQTYSRMRDLCTISLSVAGIRRSPEDLGASAQAYHAYAICMSRADYFHYLDQVTCQELPPCPRGFHCDRGLCCAPWEAGCSGYCANLSSDLANCGACGRVCPGNLECRAGKCQCPVGQPDWCPPRPPNISEYCADLKSDSGNCGDCGHVCRPGGCVAGKCNCEHLATCTIAGLHSGTSAVGPCPPGQFCYHDQCVSC